MAGKDCYWFNQGRCHLFVMGEGMVYSILTRVPKARKDLLDCGHKCPDVDAAMLEFASNPKTMVEEKHKLNEAHMRKINRYVDVHRHIEANPTTPKASSDDEEDS